MRHLFLCILAFSVVAFVACKPQKPADVPALYPCTVTVVTAGKPIEGAEVFLKAEGSGDALSINGTTDASGVAKISTVRGTYIVDGAPAGDFKVVIRQIRAVKHWKTPEEQASMSIEEMTEYGNEMQKKVDALPILVPKAYGSAETTPLKATVAKGGSTFSFDVDKK